MKKIMRLFVVALAVVVLAACGKRTYAADGTYTAWKVTENKVEITMVSVTIEKDEIKSFYIDVIQNDATKDAETGYVTGYSFKEKSKKELGYEYKMHYNSYKATVDAGTDTLEGYKAWLTANNKKEWFEQAALIEAALLNGVDSVQVTDGKISNVAGVTIKDGGYLALAAEAVELAKAGTVQTVTVSGSDVVWATGKVNKKGELSDVVLNTLQGKTTKQTAETAASFAWNAKNKQELGYEYHMHYRSYTATLEDKNTATEAGYQAWLKANNKLEWFEQAALVVEAYMANNSVEGATGVTIKTASYVEVLAALKAAVAK